MTDDHGVRVEYIHNQNNYSYKLFVGNKFVCTGYHKETLEKLAVAIRKAIADAVELAVLDSRTAMHAQCKKTYTGVGYAKGELKELRNDEGTSDPNHGGD